MLNAALVLMPEHIVRSVCIHELAHTKHFDHSAAFWNTVAQYDENYLKPQAIKKYSIACVVVYLAKITLKLSGF